MIISFTLATVYMMFVNKRGSKKAQALGSVKRFETILLMLLYKFIRFNLIELN